ncbi:ATP-binding cassette domain-containing protein [Escherichia coli]
MAGLKLQAVTKSWDGKTQVIKPLTLDVADGEFIVMVGPSGCGKSTLLRMVCNQVNHLIPTRVLVKGGEITCKILK